MWASTAFSSSFRLCVNQVMITVAIVAILFVLVIAGVVVLLVRARAWRPT